MEDNSPLRETTKEITFQTKHRSLDTFVEYIFKYINKFKIPIILFWIIAAICFAYPALSFLSSTTLFIDAPKGTPAYEANKLIEEKFPETFKTGDETIVIKKLDNQNVLTDYTKKFSRQMAMWMKDQELIVSFSGYYLLPNGTRLSTFDEKAIQSVKNKHVGESGSVTIIKIVLDDSNEKKVIAFVEEIREKIKELHTKTDEYFIGLTGFEIGSVDLQKEVELSILKMDLTCIPIAILILFAFKGYNRGGYIVFAFTKSLEANCGQVVANFAKMVCYGAVLARERHSFYQSIKENFY